MSRDLPVDNLGKNNEFDFSELSKPKRLIQHYVLIFLCKKKKKHFYTRKLIKWKQERWKRVQNNLKSNARKPLPLPQLLSTIMEYKKRILSIQTKPHYMFKLKNPWRKGPWALNRLAYLIASVESHFLICKVNSVNMHVGVDLSFYSSNNILVWLSNSIQRKQMSLVLSFDITYKT